MSAQPLQSNEQAQPSHWLHATAIALDGRAVLIRGPSGSGKSRLACDMLYHASEAGREARLIGDDKILVWQEAGAVMARGHPEIQGKLEIRGHGILALPMLQAAPVEWIIDISGLNERLPEAAFGVSRLFDFSFPTYFVSSGSVTATALLGQMLRNPAFLCKP
jgi:HPr kinase/phosphorylase